MKLLIVDNYDSFTYNISQILESLGNDVIVKRCDKISKSYILKENFDRLIISPGPGSPINATDSLRIFSDFHRKKPILGICLGHQIIGCFFGGKISKAPSPLHGCKQKILTDRKTIFRNLPAEIEVGLYNSLIIDSETIPEMLEVSAKTHDNLIMGFRHKCLPVESVQFHPDSILTVHGKKIFANWIKNEYQSTTS